MNKYVSDTMAFVLWLEDRQMPKPVKDIFSQAEAGQAEILVPAMVFAEIAYLSEKSKIDTSLAAASTYLARHAAITEHPLTFSVIRVAFEIDDIPELHDRLIAATAKDQNLAILTNDPAIRNSKHVEAIWK